MNTNYKIVLLALLAILSIFANNTEVYAQCAMCKATVESSLKEGHQAVGRGLNTGILYLMAIPYCILMFLGWYFFRDKIKGAFSSFKNIYSNPQ